MGKIINNTRIRIVTAMFVICIYPILFLYLNNIGEVASSQIVLPMITSLIVGVILFCVSYFIIKDIYKAAVVSMMFLFFIMNYKFVETAIRKLFYPLKYWHISAICIVILLHISYFIARKMSRDTCKKLVNIMTLVFSGLILVNLITATPSIIKKVNRTRDVQQIGNEQGSNIQSDNLPNIYYVVLDEYSNFKVLEKYYNYDNAVFKEFLEDKGFNISLNSRNESKSTRIVTTNYLNLDYVVGPKDDIDPYRTNPYLFKLLESYGYSINYSSDNVPVTWKDSGEAKTKGSTAGGDTFETILLKNTIYYPFLKDDSNDEYRENFEKELAFLTNSFEKENASNFTYIHFLAPHVPFVFGQNGEQVPKSESQNTSDKSYYLNQLIYVTKRMMSAIDEIHSKDPNSIIIIQSDHSMRYIGAPIGQAGEAMDEDMKNIFNTVYYQGEVLDISGQSGVNTLRIVFNDLLDLNIETVEVPSYE